MTAKEIYESETGDVCSTNQIAYSEWLIRYHTWLEKRLVAALKQSEKPSIGLDVEKLKKHLEETPREILMEEWKSISNRFPSVTQPQSEPKTAEKTLDIWLKWKPCINDIGLDASVLNAMEEHASQQPDLRRELIAFASWRDEHLSIPDTAELQVDEYLSSRTDADKPNHKEQ